MGYRHVVAQCVYGVKVYDHMQTTVDVDWNIVRKRLQKFERTKAYKKNVGKIELLGKFNRYLQEENFHDSIKEETDSHTDDDDEEEYYSDPLEEIAELLGLKLRCAELDGDCGGIVFEKFVCGSIEGFHKNGKIGIRATDKSMKMINEFRRIFRIKEEAKIHAVGKYIKE